jgi:hypothetical protein
MSFHTPINNASTTASAPSSTGAPTVTVSNGSIFGSSFPVYVTVVRSGAVVTILEITAISGNTLTVNRGVDGFADAAILSGDTIECRENAGLWTELQTAVNQKAPLASPALTGTPTAPTPSTADNSTKLATTAYVQAQGYLTTNAVTSVFSRTGAVTAQSGDYSVAQVTGAAPLASPALTGAPTAPTASNSTNTTQIATTAFVHSYVASLGYITGNQTITLSGDASGSGATSIAVTTGALQGNAVSTASPTNGQVLTWVGSTSKWTPQTPSSGAGMAIGGAVTGGDSQDVLFVDGSGNLGQNDSLTFDGTDVRYAATYGKGIRVGLNYGTLICDVAGWGGFVGSGTGVGPGLGWYTSGGNIYAMKSTGGADNFVILGYSGGRFANLFIYQVTLTGVSDASIGNAPSGQCVIYLSTDHLDGAGAPKLCRKDASGNVTVIG